MWWLLWPLARVLVMWFPYDVTYRAKIPSGPFVAAINHFSHVDPPIACVAVVRPTRFLALDELWGNSRVIDLLFRTFGVIPLPREGRRPIAAVRASLRELEAGGSVALFPEARRVKAWGDSDLKNGAAWLALRTGAPLIPIAIWGSQMAMPLDQMRLTRARVSLVVCEPIDPSAYADAEDPIGAMTEAWRGAIDVEIKRLAYSAG